MSGMDDRELERQLRLLGAAIDWPPTPELAEDVADRIGEDAPRGWRLWGPARRGLALGVLTAVVLVGTVGGIGFALGGLQVIFSDRAPGTPLAPTVVLQRGFGQPVSLDEARAELGGTLLMPSDPAVGRPDHVFFQEKTGAVALAWGSREGLPADRKTGLSVVVTEFPADIGPSTFVKIIDEGALIQRTSVGNASGFWVEGGQHFFFFRTADGKPLETTLRLVGNTLMWERDGLTLRIEGAPSLEVALRIAASMGPG